MQDALMAYPNHNLPFDICTASLDYQLGAFVLCKKEGRLPIIQGNYPPHNATILPQTDITCHRRGT